MTPSKDPDVLVWPVLTDAEIRKYAAKILCEMRQEHPEVNLRLAVTGLFYLIACAAQNDPERTTVQQNRPRAAASAPSPQEKQDEG
jgi:hypothetical protein